MGECVCFEGALSGDGVVPGVGIVFEEVKLTDSNDCAKVDGDYVKIQARARRLTCAIGLLTDGGFRAGSQWQGRDCCQRRRQPPLRLPRVRPSRRARPFRPQGDWNFDVPAGGERDDVLIANGNDIGIFVCPASSLPTGLDLVFFRREARATT